MRVCRAGDDGFKAACLLAIKSVLHFSIADE